MHDTDLSPDTVLQLAPALRTRLDAAGHVLVDSPVGTIVDIGPSGFEILSLFSQPLRLGDAIARLEDVHRNSTDFAPTISVINMLIEESALVGPDAGRARSSGWADPVEHARMLHDDRRTGDYLAALVAAVRPGDVVLDIGTGSGVLSVAAARAGARRVYAVEATDIASVAERVFEVNGVQDRVTLLTGWSRQIELPEKADLLVAEIIGNEPLEEEILETTLDARRRLLKPRARLIPHALTLVARPVQLPEAEIRQRAYGRGAVERWRDLYGIDFQPLLDAALPGPVHTITEGEVVAMWPQMGPPVVLGSLDLASFEEPSVSRVRRSRGRPSGPCQRCRDDVPRRPARWYLAHARSVDVACVQLGNLSVGAPRSGRGRPRVRAPCGLQPQGDRNSRRAHLRGRGAQPHLNRPPGARPPRALALRVDSTFAAVSQHPPGRGRNRIRAPPRTHAECG